MLVDRPVNFVAIRIAAQWLMGAAENELHQGRLEEGLQYLETLAARDGASLVLDDRRVLANPGSVGQPRDGDPRASAMILDTGTSTLTWRRVAYAIAATQAAMRAAGLPPRLAARLDDGL